MYKKLISIYEMGLNKKPIITIYGYYNKLGTITKTKTIKWKWYKKYLRKKINV